MPVMRVDTDSMDVAAGQLDAGGAELAEALNKYQGHVESMGWEANSGDAYRAAFQEWKVLAERMKENLLELSMFAKGASQNFSGAETASTIK